MPKDEKFVQSPGDRVREERKLNKLTQFQLAELSGFESVESISKIERGERNLTPKRAGELAKVFHVRKEYLLCMDNFKTENEKELFELREWDTEWKRRLNAVRVLAYLCGYEIDIFTDGKMSHSVENVLHSFDEGYKIQKDGKVLACCSLERFNLIALDCQELVEQRIKSYVREVSDNG